MAELGVARWETRGNQLYTYHTIKCDSGWYYPRHKHQDFFEIVTVRSGLLRHTVNGREYAQNAGGVMLIRDDDRHSLAGERFVMTNVMIPIWWIQRWDRLWEQPILQARLFGGEIPPLATLSDMAWADCEKALERLFWPGPSEIRQARLTQYFLNLVFEHWRPAGEGAAGSPRLPEWLADLVAWLSQPAGRPIRVEDLVERSERSPEHVCRSFRQFLGITPSQYLNRRRLERAAELLIHSQLPVLEVCYEVGFDNPSYFHRLFRQAFGQTPKAYRLDHQVMFHPPLTNRDE